MSTQSHSTNPVTRQILDRMADLELNNGNLNRDILKLEGEIVELRAVFDDQVRKPGWNSTLPVIAPPGLSTYDAAYKLMHPAPGSNPKVTW